MDKKNSTHKASKITYDELFVVHHILATTFLAMTRDVENDKYNGNILLTLTQENMYDLYQSILKTEILIKASK